jgi:hypothetical protein
MREVSSLGFLCAAMLSAHSSSAQSTGELVWDAPAECPSHDVVEREIARALGGAPRRDVRADAKVERIAAASWRLHLATEVAGHVSHRELDAPTCAELAEATALVVALESGNEAAPSPPPRTPPAPPETTTSSDSPPFQESGATAVARTIAIGISGGLSLGALANPAYGAALSAAWLPGRARVGLDVVFFPPVHIGEAATGIGGEFELYLAGVVGCYSLLDGKLGIEACVGAEAGRLAARGEGPRVEESFDEARPWLAARAGALVTYPIGRLVVRADLGAVVPFRRDRFLIEQVDTVHSAAVITFRGLAGVEMRF